MADPVQPEVLVNSILGKVSDVLINGDGDVIPKSDDHFLAFMSPGIPMLDDDFNYALEGFGGVYRRNADDKALEESTGPQETPSSNGSGPEEPSIEQQLAADALSKYMRAESFFNIVDLVPDVSGIVDNNHINTWNPETRISRVYAMALEQSQVYDNEPDEATKQKIDRWRSKLVTTTTQKDIVTDEEVQVTGDSELVKRYNEKMLGFLAAATEYNNTRISAMAGKDQEAVHRLAVNGALEQMKVRAAMNAWSTTGHKGDYEKLSAAIQSVEDRAFVLLKQRYKEDYFRSLLTNPSSGSNFLYCAPASASFARSGAGWSRFYFNSSSFQSNHSFQSSSTQAGGGFHIGSFGAVGGGSVEKQKWEGGIDTSQFRMEFQMCRVPIARPWLNIDYLLSGFWRFDENNDVVKNTMVSDGEKPPSGLMPAITTDCIFIKDLTIHFGESNTEWKRHRDSASGGGGISFGPFHAGGRHSQESGSSEFAATYSDQGVSVDGMQLLAVVGWTLPQSPNPNPNITQWI